MRKRFALIYGRIRAAAAVAALLLAIAVALAWVASHRAPTGFQRIWPRALPTHARGELVDVRSSCFYVNHRGTFALTLQYVSEPEKAGTWLNVSKVDVVSRPTVLLVDFEPGEFIPGGDGEPREGQVRYANRIQAFAALGHVPDSEREAVVYRRELGFDWRWGRSEDQWGPLIPSNRKLRDGEEIPRVKMQALTDEMGRIMPSARSGMVMTPHWFLLLVSLLPVAWWARGYPTRRRRRRWLAEGRCLHCGYDLRSSAERCPECGTVPPARAEATA